MSDNPDWQKADARAVLAATLNREAPKEKIEFKPLGKAVLFEWRAPASNIILTGTSTVGRRAFVAALGSGVPADSGLVVGDEIGIVPARNYSSMEALVGDAGKDLYIAKDWEHDIVCVLKREGR